MRSSPEQKTSKGGENPLCTFSFCCHYIISSISFRLSIDKFGLSVQVTTWERDSHDLFDYEATPVHRKQFALCSAGKIFRVGTDVLCLPDDEKCPNDADYLLSIRMHVSRGTSTAHNSESTPSDAQYEIAPAERGLLTGLTQKKLWRIVRDLPEQKHVLCENDIIKLGRCKLKVRQLVRAGENIEDLRFDDGSSVSANKTIAEMKKLQCRICLGEGGTDDDPLFVACGCKGTIEHVHVECLQKWICGRLNFTESARNCFYIKLLWCELCKRAFPIVVKRRDKLFRMVQLPTNAFSPPLIVLENVVGNNPRAYHIINVTEGKDVKLGRGHECDVRISDVSISRHHATIRFLNGQFLLEDHFSKFGTLVSLKHPLPVMQSDRLVFQAGRSVVKVNFLSDTPLDEQTSEAVDMGNQVQSHDVTLWNQKFQFP
ncbi:FHA domain-containing protein [Cardiosporidium cionae]|uniref:FHA domain-containing protein n=1 Tax=Cardiosporidium cionae TaxID=476202 RepID=A0ABQ7JDH6_9APIC|nr:FHA domain-containing protein [Cardiosporidium cionae]|eukprot:KAF8822031.1 FHA domain-containing protein [Cardiosporidium cionae]